MNSEENYYYKIVLSYETPINVLDDQDPNKVQAREVLYESLRNLVPDNDKYEKFSVKLLLHQLKDTMNYIMTYEVFFRSYGLPMKEYINAEEFKKNAEKEIENFLDSIDCEYKQLNIQPLL
jgi:hypothetical protein